MVAFRSAGCQARLVRNRIDRSDLSDRTDPSDNRQAQRAWRPALLDWGHGFM